MTSRSTSPYSGPDVRAQVEDLRRFLDECPTPHHVVATAAARLREAGFVQHDLARSFPAQLGGNDKGFVTRGGALIAYVVPDDPRVQAGSTAGSSGEVASRFDVIGAHTDSPGLHLKHNPEGQSHNVGTLEVEVYGSPLLNSWLDRDLGMAGHVVCSDGTEVPFRTTAPIARLAQLAIHLDRNVNDSGVVLDKHQHLRPLWATGDSSANVRELAASLAGITPSGVVAVHAQLFDCEPARVIGVDESMLASGRLDNQLSCWAAITALVAARPRRGVAVVALFDHEEVGSASTTGAAGPLLEHVLEHVALALGRSRAEYLAMLANSVCLSCDNAHAVHPNYPERHDPKHAPLLNRGVALKINANQRYATSMTSSAVFHAACAAAQVSSQAFQSRNNMPCGSTIGPITATRLGINTIDIGVPQLSMHSAREVCGVSDALDLPKIAREFLNR